jgi:hypothetical protein
MREEELVAIRRRDAQWGEATPGSGPAWTRDELARAYLIAGVDRHALVRELDRVRDLWAQCRDSCFDPTLVERPQEPGDTLGL